MARVLRALPANLDAYNDRWTAFGQLLDEIEAALEGLPANSQWPIVGKSGNQIGVVPLADFRRKFDNFSWSLTDKDYSSVNGGVGQVVSRFDQDRSWVGAKEEIRASDFGTYMKWSERQGATYLALHEVAHTTEMAMGCYATLYDEFIHMGGDRDHFARSPQWWYNERIANRIALTVAEAINFPILNDPTGGYNLDVVIRQMEIA
jgi:hypothetical protein